VFVERGALDALAAANPSAHAAIARVLAEEFAPAESSGRWVVYRRD
jgi:hypothetical protein